jgi:outer membrane lipoprotein-sorting protein
MYRTLTLLTAVAFSLNAMTADEILDSMEANQEPQSSRMEVTQVVYPASGSERTSKLLSYSKDKGDRGLMEYVTPARIKGMKILMLNDGDDIWLFSPRTARVRKIASHQKNQSVNNSDFSYEDLSGSDNRDEYDSKVDGTEKVAGAECYKITMTAKGGSDESYSKIVYWVDKEKFLPMQAHFYDEDGEKWKVLTLSDISKQGTYWAYGTVEMKNVLKGSRTVMKMTKIEYDVELDDAMFSERYLKK